MIDLSMMRTGLKGSADLLVGVEHTAPRVGSGRVPVLATPVMINVIEAAALAAVERTGRGRVEFDRRFSAGVLHCSTIDPTSFQRPAAALYRRPRHAVAGTLIVIAEDCAIGGPA